MTPIKKQKPEPKSRPAQHNNFADVYYEAEVAEGLEIIAADEISQLLNVRVDVQRGAIRFCHDTAFEVLLKLRSVIAVYECVTFDVPRPKALLGHQHFHTLARHIQRICAFHPEGTFHTLSISAAGSGSSVMQRLRDELGAHTHLQPDASAGDLMLRIRRSQQGGWEVLIRLTSRPLATRSWRACNMPGALNASVAYAMLRMGAEAPAGRCLNIACGSGTIMIEALQMQPEQMIAGCDVAMDALICAQQNLNAAAVETPVQLLQGDGTKLPFANSSFSTLYADLPFGQLTGSHDKNKQLYPAILAEAARVAVPGALFICITHEIKLMERCISRAPEWQFLTQQMVTLTGLHPRIYILRRR